MRRRHGGTGLHSLSTCGNGATARRRGLFPRCASCGNAGSVQTVALRLKINQAEFKKNGFEQDYLDYSHEREWRLLENLEFDYADISFLVVDKAEEIEEIVKVTNGGVSTNLILPMSTYKMIESLWPVHKIDTTL